MDTSVVCDDSDSEVFEVSGSTPAAPVAAGATASTVESSHDQSSANAAARIYSSSSSSCDDRHSKASSHESPEPTLLDGSNSGGHHIHHHHHHHHQHHTVSGQTVEWRPMNSKPAEDSSGTSMMLRNSRVMRKTPSDDLQSPQDHNNIHNLTTHSGTVTVMIDPPNDDQQLYAESAVDDLGSRLVFRCPSASEEENIDLFADLDDSDSEGEEAEGGTAFMKTCLLSR